MAAILDERSSSDGDIFPAMFKQAGLGPLIGRRSWGGVVGISGRGPLIDGGGISVPESGMANTRASGSSKATASIRTSTSINDVKATIEGKDQQLERAVAEVMKKLRSRHDDEVPGQARGPGKTGPRAGRG